MQRIAQGAMTALCVTAGYIACTLIGTLLSVPPDGFAIIWPATAFLIGIGLVVPSERLWPCIVGIVPTHFLLASILQPAAPLVVVSTQVAGNLTLAGASILAIQRVDPPHPRFDTIRSVSLFVLIAGFAVPAVVNTLILGVHLATGWIDNLWLSWRQWMIAGVFPTVTLPPLIVLAVNGKLTGGVAVSRRAQMELAVVSTVLFAIVLLTMGGTANATHWPALFLAPIPFLLWAAVRLGVGGTCIALLVLAAAVVTRALNHQGPFGAQTPIAEVMSLQAFLIAVSIPLILLASLMDDRRLMQIETDELRERLASLRNDERRRIAQELHDSTAQHLVAASLNLTHLQAKVSDVMQGLVDEIILSVREASTEIRTFSYLLNPPQLESEGLCEMLRQYVPGFGRRTGVRTSLRISPLASELPAEHQHALLRITQESLGNVHRHARATSVLISLRCIAGCAHVVIQDDGIGIEAAAGEDVSKRLLLGTGIPTMRARVSQLGGRIRFRDRHKGTIVHVAIPIKSPVSTHLAARVQRSLWPSR